jgi:hypothetical protein
MRFPHSRRHCWQSVHIRIPISTIESVVISSPDILNPSYTGDVSRHLKYPIFEQASVEKKKLVKKKETASPVQYSSRTLPQTKNFIEKLILT